MAILAGLEVADPARLWADLGFTVTDGTCRVGGLDITLTGTGTGITSWSLAGLDAARDSSEPGREGLTLDGLPTRLVPDGARGADPVHANGVTALDHVVVSSPDLERTVGVLAGYGILERRRRQADRPGRPASTQVFFRLGPAILELVGAAGPAAGEGPSRFWGLAFTVSDLDTTARALGDRLRPLRPAVQPDRFIAALDHSAGSSVEIAFMSPA